MTSVDPPPNRLRAKGAVARAFTRTWGLAAPSVSAALSVVLPARCLGCGTIVERPGSLCASCWDRVTFLGPPHCARCGLPFEHDHGEGMICLDCHRASPPFGRARAAMRYDPESRGLILGLKHGDRTDGAPSYGRWMARAAGPLLDDADLVIPVPLHWSRLAKRRYNQSALLARAVAEVAGKPFSPRLLTRVRRTRPLGDMNATARRRVLQGAFRVPEDRRAALRDKHVLLVDDVLTTGSTANACARTLLRAGAASVDVLTLARIVRGMP